MWPIVGWCMCYRHVRTCMCGEGSGENLASSVMTWHRADTHLAPSVWPPRPPLNQELSEDSAKPGAASQAAPSPVADCLAGIDLGELNPGQSALRAAVAGAGGLGWEAAGGSCQSQCVRETGLPGTGSRR